jgi:hypothetical protein
VRPDRLARRADHERLNVARLELVTCRIRFALGRGVYECPYLGGSALDDDELEELARAHWPLMKYFGSCVTAGAAVLRDTRRTPDWWTPAPDPVTAPAPAADRQDAARAEAPAPSTLNPAGADTAATRRVRRPAMLRSGPPRDPPSYSTGEPTCSLAGAALPVSIPYQSFTDLSLGVDHRHEPLTDDELRAWDLLRQLTRAPRRAHR